jgi:hypothetical protein
MGFLSHENSFQRWVLTPQEIEQGSVLTLTQKQVIQNQITQLAEEQILLPFSADNIQRNAELIGAINALKYLIDVSNEVEKHLHSAAINIQSEDYNSPRSHSPEN